MLARLEPVVERGARAAYVQRACGGRGKADADGRCLGRGYGEAEVARGVGYGGFEGGEGGEGGDAEGGGGDEGGFAED